MVMPRSCMIEYAPEFTSARIAFLGPGMNRFLYVFFAEMGLRVTERRCDTYSTRLFPLDSFDSKPASNHKSPNQHPTTNSLKQTIQTKQQALTL